MNPASADRLRASVLPHFHALTFENTTCPVKEKLLTDQETRLLILSRSFFRSISKSLAQLATTKATRYTSCMSSKDKILSVIQTLPDDVSVDEAIDRLYLLSKIERGIREADAGDIVDHDAVMIELLDDET